MPTPDPSEPLLIPDLSIEVEDYGGKTMTVHRIKQNGKIKFTNRNLVQPLTISSPAADSPFVPEGCSNAVSSFVVPANDKMTVTIAPTYVLGMKFTYSAQINGTSAEDPIVIVDRR